MIPKIIHYCWFGGKEKPELIRKCIESWKIKCPEYEIIEWNEDNFDVESLPYMKKAYELKKWAFVSDVARLMVLIEYGGIYLDTDVEVLEDHVLDRYLEYGNVLAFENERSINTGMFCAAEKDSKLFKSFLRVYKETLLDKEFTTNTAMNKPIIKREFPTLKWDATRQIMNNTYFLSAHEYYTTMKHYGTRSWLDNNPQYKISRNNFLKRKLRNPKIFAFLDKTSVGRKIVPVYEFLSYDLLDLGIMYYIKKVF